MNDAINKTYLMKFDSSINAKSRSQNKDLFSQKLGQSIKFNTSIYKKRMPSLKIAKFQSHIPKNNTNILLSFEKDDDISDIIYKLNSPFFYTKAKKWNNENDKQMIKNQTLINNYNTNVRFNKKQIKEILDLKQKYSFNEIKSDKKLDTFNYSKEKERQKHSMMDLDNINARKIIDTISQKNSQINFNRKEISKETFGGYRKINNKKIEMKRNKNNTKESMNISLISINKNKIIEDKNKENKENKNPKEDKNKSKELKNNENKIKEYLDKDKDKEEKNNNNTNENETKEDKYKENKDKDNNKDNKEKEDKNQNNKNNEESKNKEISKNEIKEIEDKENQNKDIKDIEDKDSIIFLTHFYEDFIELVNSYNSIGKYKCSINNFNQTYIFLFDLKAFPRTTMNIQFLHTFKYTSILVICLIFLTKDEKLYKPTVSKMKELLQNFFLICINSINYKLFLTEKIKNFMKNKSSSNQQYKTLIEIIDQIINLLFNDKMNDYKKLRKCLRQLLYNINNDTPEKILNIVNNSLLYCHNCNYYLEESKRKKHKKKKNNSKANIKKDNKEEEKSLNQNIHAPYIKTKMEKKYCLVLDLDETLLHNLNLPFGDYFFVRPGLFDFLEKIHDLYEIIIFTASKRNYAYSIIDKIDYNNYISHILHKKYIIYENGSPIKKLDLIGRDLNKLIFVDNLETCAKYNKKNLYCISSWYNNIYDNELYKLQEKLIYIATSGQFDDDITKGLLEK
jgi:hypothetical protein